MRSDPEELLRSIERTREEVALTIDTIAGRLDPKLAARRGIGAVRSSVVDVIDGARVKLHLGQERRVAGLPEGSSAPSGDHRAARALESVSRVVKAKADAVTPAIRRMPMPAVGGGLAALLALAAVLAVLNRRRRR